MKQNFRARLSRRGFLRLGTQALVAAGFVGSLPGCSKSPDPETETVMLAPEGFIPRIVARSGFPSSANPDYLWHRAPDGGACFDAGDGGWVYVSNSEDISGGVGVLRFDSNATVIDSYSILSASRRNCSGGPTPWGSWLSCEEIADGRVWECDPFNTQPARAYTSLGLFAHEAACVDPLTQQIYMTEDKGDGGLYRFTPQNALLQPIPDLASGKLEIAVVAGGLVHWEEVPDPLAASNPTRRQVTGSASFAGGEGIDIYDRFVRFTTKYDNRVWELNLVDSSIRIAQRLGGRINDVDDITHTLSGGFLVAEDGPEMRVLYFSDSGATPITLLRLPEHRESEITGLAFDPSGSRLYFSSQRGNTGKSQDGISFELQGNFSALGPDLALSEWVLDHRDISLQGKTREAIV